MYPIGIHNTDSISQVRTGLTLSIKINLEHCDNFQIELFHDQLPLAVPCYDLVPVTKLTLGPTYVETSGTPGSLDLTGGEYKT